jgi:serine/threonine-protein kinase RsbW
MKNHTFKMIVQADMSSLYPVLSAIDELVKNAGFKQKEAQEIRLAAEEAVSNVIQHGYEGLDDESFELICQYSGFDFRITIHEKGVPFFPSEDSDFRVRNVDENLQRVGLGLFLMRHYMDEVSFHNLGKNGKETVLVKNLWTKLPEFPVPSERGSVHTGPDPAPSEPRKINYRIRPLEPRDAGNLAVAAFRSYGYTYDEYIYYPEQIIAMNQQGEIYSVVAVADEITVMGHIALKMNVKDAPIAEMGVAFVCPEYRSMHTAQEMADLIHEQAHAMGLKGIYIQAVTAHIISQKAVVKHRGFKDCAILLGAFPLNSNYKGIEAHNEQKESADLLFLPFGSRMAPVLYPPVEHADLINQTYLNMGLEADLRKTDVLSIPAKTEPTRLRIVSNEGINSAEIWIDHLGHDAGFMVKRALKELCLERIDAVYLYMDLTYPLTGLLTPYFQAEGFFYSGIMPYGLGGHDALILQYLNNLKLDYERIKIYSDWGREILQYIRERAK